MNWIFCAQTCSRRQHARLCQKLQTSMLQPQREMVYLERVCGYVEKSPRERIYFQQMRDLAHMRLHTKPLQLLQGATGHLIPTLIQGEADYLPGLVSTLVSWSNPTFDYCACAGGVIRVPQGGWYTTPTYECAGPRHTRTNQNTNKNIKTGREKNKPKL